tara:strand:+ start:5010 stop:7217 length:2208 start_codon:yes stop_codon:yes gene_type:complete
MYLNGADYLIYTTKDFENSANLMSDFHEIEMGQWSLNTEIIFKEDLEEINQTIEQYISENTNLIYLLIIGDETIIEPKYYFSTPTDDLFAYDIISNYPIPKLKIGRLIASNNNEAEQQINKIRDYTIAYSESEMWKNKLLLLADDQHQSGNSIREEKYHTVLSNKIYNELSNLIPTIPIYGIDYPRQQTSDWYLQPELTENLIEIINSGVGMINYIGHGTHEILSTEDLISLNRDLDLIQTNNKPPIWIVGTCSFGDYINKDSMAEALMLSEDAAIAVIATTNGISPESNWHYLKNFFNTHLKNHIENSSNQVELTRLGDVFYDAKISALTTALSNEYPNNVYGGYRFNIFGDPAMPLQISQESNEIVDIDTLFIGEPNILTVNSENLNNPSLQTNIQILDEDKNINHTFNYEVNGEHYNPSIIDSCLQFPHLFNYTVNPETNDSSICFDNINYSIPGVSLYENSFIHTSNFYIPLEIDINNHLKAFINNKELIQCISDIPIQISSNLNAIDDIDGPNIEVYFNNEELTNNTVIFTPYTFKIEITDNLPLNLSGLNYHSIRLWIDNNQSNSIILNDFFNYDNNSDTSGKILYTINDSLLDNKKHTLNIEAWDIINNQSIISYDVNNMFNINNNVFNIYTIPNPFSEKTFFTFSIKNPQPIYIKIDIFNKNGQKINTLNLFEEDSKSFHAVPDNGWDGKDRFNRNLKNGTYFYELKIQNINKETILKKINNLTIIK